MEEPQKKHQCTREELQQRVKYCLDLLRRHVLSDGTILTHRRIASLAAEQLDRNCYGMEISPQYCDVIVNRWQNLTGKKAVCLQSNGS